VIELATFGAFNETQQAFLDQLMESIGIVLSTIAANMRTEGLLEQSQLLTAELQAQQEELKKTNDRLELQAASLRQSEELLRSKQDELQQTNAELEDKAVLLSAQNKQVEAKNTEVEQAKAALEEKAEQLALTSKYKSEFLANMSHELRTPLNSLLILSKMLSENAQGNLSAKQVEFARNIHSAGADLLGLINDILDLSKIESGTVTLDIGEMSFASLRDQTDRTFSQLAQDKKLDFFINIDPALPRSMYTDDKRLQQVIKNLLSNAFKFTQAGSVRLSIARAEDGWALGNDHLNKAGQVLAFSVEDTGIGIPEDKQRIIFEAFQQADGTTSRKYGGTGLGLSISREITRLLGGELRVVSTPGQGSTFTLYLPLNFSPAAQSSRAQPLRPATSPVQTFRLSTMEAGSAEPAETVVDDREQIEPGDAVILIVEDDTRFASILLSLVRDGGFKGVVTGEGSAVPSLARRFTPDAIMLDIGLPDMDGLALLDLLKRTPDTRHIPVQVISADDHGGPWPVDGRLRLHQQAGGARGGRLDAGEGQEAGRRDRPRPDPGRRRGPGRRHAARDHRRGEGRGGPVRPAGRGLHRRGRLPGDRRRRRAGRSVHRHLKQRGAVSGVAVLYAPEDLDPEEDRRLRLAVFSGLARLARTPEQLIDHVTMSLHAPLERLSSPARAMIAHSRHADAVLTGLTAVVIDDDIRNIFSLASAWRSTGSSCATPKAAAKDWSLLDSLPAVDMVLVDIMMPDMDGYETMREIRARPRFSDLPVIAVTAKAMKGDRQKCIQAGASDYVSKPVDIDQLISVLRVSVQRTDAQRLAGDNVVTIHSAAAAQ
jgi:signal transduction histidine kinase/CheY-like chemotaxis protein